MNRQRIQRVFAAALLSIYVSVMMPAVLHHHETRAVASSECLDCAHKVPHSGHFSQRDGSIHDCVLCQFLTLAYAPAAVLCPGVLLCLTRVVRPQHACFDCAETGRRHSPRAPPFIL